MFGKYPLSLRFFAFVAVPLALCGTAILLHFRASLPAHDGKPVSAAVAAPVDIVRDGHGVAYIQAHSDADAFFALGYAHAQDRLWQLELQRRIAQGRLAEIFGEPALRQDVWMRTLGLYAAAESSWSALDAEARASLSAYAAGINAYIARKPVLPPEFSLLGVEPQPWREIDSLAWAKVFALNLAGNMKNEVSGWVASQYLSPAQLADLGLPAADAPATAARQAQSLDLALLQRELEDSLRIGGRYVGSNAWAVAGAKMSDGRAALANDAHLGLQIPSLWYVAHLKGDRLDVAGMTLVGLPVVIFGRNASIAWGGTSMTADVQDLYLEQPNPADPREYARDGGWRRFESRSETITVKADFPAALRGKVAPVTIQIRSTEDGPVVSDVVGALDQPVALKWTALQPGDASYQAFLRANYATDWDSFRRAFEAFVAPALNLVYIDASDNIAAIGVGRIPLRSKGDGRLPAPGWSGAYRWNGYVPFAEWPQQLNPASGMIVTANDGPAGPDGGHFISADWAPPYRAERIRELLAQGSGAGLSLQDFQRIQGDTVDKGAAGLLAYLRTFTPQDAKQQQALAYLADWNGDMARDSVAATIFFVWTRHLREELFERTVASFWNRPQQQRELNLIAANIGYGQMLTALTGSAPNWCGAGVAPPCSDVLQRSLAAALRELEKSVGGTMQKWRWGDVHHTVYEHMAFSQAGVLGALFERRVANGGSPDTVNVANAQYRESVGYDQAFGPGFRQIVQFGTAGARHDYMNSTGQSGNVLSPFYDDMVKPFRDVAYFTLGAVPGAPDRWNTQLVPERN